MNVHSPLKGLIPLFALIATLHGHSRGWHPRAITLLPVSLLLLFSSLGFFSSCEEPEDEPWQCLQDTTSHYFTWKVDSIVTDLGPPLPGLSVLNDMAVISEDDIWLVGEFNAPDTSQYGSSGDLQTYNVIHWDGGKWEYFRILGDYRDQYYGFDDIKAIHAFAPNDIWAMFGFGAYTHWNGEEWNSEYIWEIAGTPDNVWGISSSNFYIVGYQGSITHYNGTSFTAMRSGTTTTLRKIFGLDASNIWIIGYADKTTQQNLLLKYDDGSWVEIHHQDDWQENWPPQDYNRPSGPYLSTWAYGDTLYLGCASLWKQSISTSEGYLMRPEQMDWDLMYGVGTIAGNHCNDIFAFMAVGLGMTHYNGVDWIRDARLQSLDPGRDFVICSAHVDGDFVAICGMDYSSMTLLLIKGYRE